MDNQKQRKNYNIRFNSRNTFLWVDRNDITIKSKNIRIKIGKEDSHHITQDKQSDQTSTLSF